MKKIVISAIMLVALAGTSVFAAQGNKKPAKTTKMATSNKMESSNKMGTKGKAKHRRHHKAKAKTGGKMTKNSKM